MSKPIENRNEPDGQIVTFYSYKGGVGRTFALANIAAQLVKWGYRVLCVDWDLEAPGLEKYFSVLKEEKSEAGLVELLESPSVEKDWRKSVSTYWLPNECDLKHGVDVIRAGADSENYVQRVQNLDWGKLYLENGLGIVLEHLRREWKSEYDFILIDSRTGVTDIGGICTVQLPDILVPLMTANHQNFDGSNDVIKRAINSRNRFEFDRGGLLVMPILSRFDSREEYEQSKKWRHLFVEKVGWTIDVWRDHNVKQADIANYLVVPYFSYWSFGERLPVVEENVATSDSIKYSFQTLASLLAKNLSNSSKLVNNRDSYVTSANRSEHAPSNFDVFMSYHGSDKYNIESSRHLIGSLQNQGLSVFYQLDDLELGVLHASISSLIESSKIVVFVLSNEHDSRQISEMVMASKIGKPIVVVSLGVEETERISRFVDQGIVARFVFNRHFLTSSDTEQIAERVKHVLKHSTFLSYSRNDSKDVEAIAKWLLGQGVSVWFDKWSLVPGEPWQPALEKGIAESETLCAFVGSSGLGPWAEAETRAAINRQIKDSSKNFRVIPVLLPSISKPSDVELPEFLKANTWVEFGSEDDKEALHRLLSGIRGEPPTPKSEKTTSSQPPSSNRITDSGNWVLLSNHLVQSSRVVQQNDGLWSIEVVANDAHEDAALSSLRQRNSFGSQTTVPFAHQNDGFNSRVESIDSESVNGKKTFTIQLKKESRDSHFLTDVQYSNNGKTFTPQQVATLRASRILINDPPAPTQNKNSNQMSSRNWNSVMDESMIMGYGAVKVNVCAIKSVFESSDGDAKEKLAQARLLAVYYLKVTGVIEHVLKLELGMTKQNKVSVDFHGIRPRQYSNVDPEEVRVAGNVDV